MYFTTQFIIKIIEFDTLKILSFRHLGYTNLVSDDRLDQCRLSQVEYWELCELCSLPSSAHLITRRHPLKKKKKQDLSKNGILQYVKDRDYYLGHRTQPRRAEVYPTTHNFYFNRKVLEEMKNGVANVQSSLGEMIQNLN